MINYRQVAKSSPIFKDLNEQKKDELLKEGKIHYLDKKKFLFRHGDPVTNFYIVCFGTIQAFRSNADGSEKTLHIFTAHDTICGNEIYESYKAHKFNAIAVSDAVVIEIPKNSIKENTKKNGDFALNLLAEISRLEQEAELEAEHQASMSAMQLVSCFLQKLCLIHNFNPHEFQLPYNKKLIASRLGMELETFSRTLPKLREYGIIVAGSHVRINNKDRIEENVCNHCSIEGDCQMHENFKKKF